MTNLSDDVGNLPHRLFKMNARLSEARSTLREVVKEYSYQKGVYPSQERVRQFEDFASNFAAAANEVRAFCPEDPDGIADKLSADALDFARNSKTLASMIPGYSWQPGAVYGAGWDRCLDAPISHVTAAHQLVIERLVEDARRTAAMTGTMLTLQAVSR